MPIMRTNVICVNTNGRGNPGTYAVYCSSIKAALEDVGAVLEMVLMGKCIMLQMQLCVFVLKFSVILIYVCLFALCGLFLAVHLGPQHSRWVFIFASEGLIFGNNLLNLLTSCQNHPSVLLSMLTHKLSMAILGHSRFLFN